MVTRAPKEKPAKMELIEDKTGGRDSLPIAQRQAEVDTSPQAMLFMAVQRGATIEELRELKQLAKELREEQAKIAYNEDMALFKRNAPTIIKDKLVAFKMREGGETSYTHATIGNVVETIVPKLAEFGFSHDWKVTRLDDGQHRVTCTITHRQGHSESVWLAAHSDDSGKKNKIQQMASAVTYLQRYTLLAVLGLATKDQDDDDGRHTGADDPLEEDLQDLIETMQRCTKDADALKFWNENKARFTGNRPLYDRFKQECANHREFIQNADKGR